METLFIDQTYETPEVQIDFVQGVFSIKGRSIPEKADKFWDTFSEEIFKFDRDRELEFILNLEYLNISSSKKLLHIFYKLNSEFKNVKVTWYYEENDEDMYEVGRDYEHMSTLPFEFKINKI